jgi:sulfate adenylyltransferase large subunit
MGKEEPGMEKTLRFTIVGHVDHGKSTLIGRLLYDTNSLPEGKIEEIESICKQLGKELEFGFILDHLQEEREQGVTIDTTQTFLRTDSRDYVIIDAPGHREFVKNMITGASQAEAAVLIVDVNEGVGEQTKRHAYILSMLSLSQVIVVMNKMDLVEYGKERFEEVEKDLLKFLGSINIRPTYIIPISARDGDNIAKRSENIGWYEGMTLLQALESFTTMQSLSDRPFRFPVQDVYKFDDKRILAGRIESGAVETGEEVVVLPSGEKTKVKSVEMYLEDRTKAESGESIGLTLEDPLFTDRGDVIASVKEPPVLRKEIPGHVFWMDKSPLTSSERIVFKCATQERKCSVGEITRVLDSSTLEVLRTGADSLENREVADVVVSLESPVVVEDFNTIPALGRFVLERDKRVCAAGVITGLDKAKQEKK